MRVVRLAPVAGALLLALAALAVFAPGAWMHLGFPLDDSWIHAVYGRELARSGMLAYNPGIAAAGETSPLWAVVFAIPHLISSDPWTVTFLIKVLGFGLHGVTALLALRVAERLQAGPFTAGLTAIMVALHPDLVAASISGMEIPLATALVLWVTLEVLRGPSWRLAVVCFLAPFGRPEVACVPVFLIAMRIIAADGNVSGVGIGRSTHRFHVNWRAVGGFLLTAGGGTLASFAALAIRNVLVTGRPMPSTFYAKVVGTTISPWMVQWIGFHRLLQHFALVNSLLLLVPLAALALWLLLRPRLQPQAAIMGHTANRAAAADAPADRASTDAHAPDPHSPDPHAAEPSSPAAVRAAALAGGLFLAGLAFFSVSFALSPPTGHKAFYFQRYALPGLPLVLTALPLLIETALRALPATRLPRLPVLRAAIATALAVGLLAPMPGRLRHFANDALNIDDVQVAEGRALATASPHHIVWAVDAGAVRYFGNAFVVDMMGLNTPEILTRARADYLARHQPHYISIVGGGWAEVDSASRRVMDTAVFEPTTPYTVTSYMPQAVHRLIRCPASPHRGLYQCWGRRNEFVCGTW